MSLNRTLSPENQTIEQINLLHPVLSKLDNGIRLYLIEGGVQDVCKIEFVFDAGAYFQPGPLIARFTNLLMSEGTSKHSGFEIASVLEYFGAYLNSYTQKDVAGFSLSILNSKIANVLPVVEEIFKSAIFPEKELQLLVSKEKKNFIDDCRKVDRVAMHEFNELIFGSGHPYGKKAKLDDFDKVQQQDLKDFFTGHYHAGNCFFIATGKMHPEIEIFLNRHFGGKDWLSEKPIRETDVKPFVSSSAEKAFKEMPDAIQNAVRIGKRTIGLSHPDQPKLAVVNTVLGGYFGSRLMANIREDKGYTYGIYSVLASFRKSGVFYVSSEVGAEIWQEAISEIYKEIDRLCNEMVSESELKLVKNYMLGNLLRSIDSPFTTAAFFQSCIESGIEFNAYVQVLFETIRNITSYDILNIAKKYLNSQTLSEQIAGRK
jgi:zinc protease